ncbi:MAG TPA: acetolactate synthase small subunit [Bryobacterales bacterium]|nr:acetolactate synthase small subunit [Bryobacterales bacterium]
MLQLISLLVENKPGALMRVTGVLSARGYNIESLTVARTLDPELSRMTIVAEVESPMRPLLIKQIQRLINVIQVVDLSDQQVVCRETMLAKVQVSEEMKATFLREVEIFRARVVDASPGAYTVEATGASEKLDAFIEMLRTYGDIEVIRSGAMALPRSTKENKKAGAKGKDLKKVGV